MLPLDTGDIAYHDPVVDIHGLGPESEFLGRMSASTPDLITTVEDETCIDGKYAATSTRVGAFDGNSCSAEGMSIVKFRPRETQAFYPLDDDTEGDIMIDSPGPAEPTAAFRSYDRCAVDPSFPCPF